MTNSPPLQSVPTDLSPKKSVRPAGLAGARHLSTGALEPGADCAGVVTRLKARNDHPNSVSLISFAAILEDITDVPSAVALAGVVHAGVPDLSPVPQIDDGSWLVTHVEAQLDSQSRFLTRRLREPFFGTNALPSEEKACGLLVTEKTLTAGETERIVADLARSWGQRLLALIRTIRRDAVRIRSEIAPELRARGGVAAYLERLDGALRRAMAHTQADRDMALSDLVIADAKRGMTAALDAFKAPPEPAPVSSAEAKAAEISPVPDRLRRSDIARWYRRGFARNLRSDIDALIRAIAAEERTLLMHLASADIAA